jgi:polyisoprenoid-binding protein YceI
MTTWKIDNGHSQIQFKIKHMVITNVTGSFDKFDATMESSKDDFTDAKITFEADASSINTGNEKRDGHLKGADFFNTAQYPKLSFVSKVVKKTDSNHYKVDGDITIRDVTKPISLDVLYNGTVLNPWGKTVAGFEITGKINRMDFGLTWSGKTAAGELMAGDEVKLDINAEMIKQD